MKKFYTLLVISLTLTIALGYMSIIIGNLILFGLSLLSFKVLVTTIIFSLYEKKVKKSLVV